MFMIIILLSTSNFYCQDEWTVSTFNIRYDNPSDPLTWDDRKKEVVRAIAYFDIVGLQEVLPHQLKYIKNSLPLNSSYSVTRFGSQDGEACPIFWKTDAYDLLHSEKPHRLNCYLIFFHNQKYSVPHQIPQ